MKNKDQVFLLLGGNLGNVFETFKKATKLIEALGDIQKTSSVYQTSPWGMTKAADFLNQVLVMQTDMEPLELLNHLKEIEKQLGRKRKTASVSGGYESRELDIDILMWGNRVLSTEELHIPHPRMHQRAFTMVPLAEVDDKFIHPIFDLSIKQLLDQLQDSLNVSKV